MFSELAPPGATRARGAGFSRSSSQLLPRDEERAVPGLSPPAEMPVHYEQKPRALVVDDAPDVTEMIALLLSYSGYDTAAVFSAPDALDAARREHFDVIVSDIGMPGMTGYDLASALRALPGYASVPMVAVSGFTMYDDRERALESGFNAFLTKPINPLDLIDVIKSLRG